MASEQDFPEEAVAKTFVWDEQSLLAETETWAAVPVLNRAAIEALDALSIVQVPDAPKSAAVTADMVAVEAVARPKYVALSEVMQETIASDSPALVAEEELPEMETEAEAADEEMEGLSNEELLAKVFPNGIEAEFPDGVPLRVLADFFLGNIGSGYDKWTDLDALVFDALLGHSSYDEEEFLAEVDFILQQHIEFIASLYGNENELFASIVDTLSSEAAFEDMKFLNQLVFQHFMDSDAFAEWLLLEEEWANHDYYADFDICVLPEPDPALLHGDYVMV